MKRWGIVLAALLLTAGCALADDGGFGLDNERAQAIYWEYSRLFQFFPKRIVFFTANRPPSLHTQTECPP